MLASLFEESWLQEQFSWLQGNFICDAAGLVVAEYQAYRPPMQSRHAWCGTPVFHTRGEAVM
ncbi:MAG: hypothetical protein DMG58_16670 [Acidobacteria bacterium]|nr:MAG: hypothetical protein DMG58_16670 [Acidobacteriota bacterium]